MAWGQTDNVAVQQAKPPSAFPEWDTKTQDEVLVEWQRLQSLLAGFKEVEMSFRKYVVNRAFPDKHEGVNTIELGKGFELKAGIKFNYRLDPDNKKIEQALDKLCAMGNEGPFLADRLVNWKASLVLKEYRELKPQYKKIIDEVVTIDDAAPTLEIKQPKVKK